MQEKRPHYFVKSQGKVLTPVQMPDGTREYRVSGGNMRVFSVWPGIDLIYQNFSVKECECSLEVSGEFLGISYCHMGQEECEWVCGDHLYLGAGDLSITRMENRQPPFYFPEERYQGIVLMLDLGILREIPLPILGEYPLSLADKFCKGRHFFAMRANSHIVHIFSELYEIPEDVRDDYCKIKTLEMLMFLYLTDPAKERQLDKITKEQINIVKAVRERLCEDLSQDPTIEQLAREFCVSPTALKANFKLIYRSSLKEYLRRERMEHAAQLLRTEHIPVSEIARQVGYASQSKFSAAFKTAFGSSPMEYRKKCVHDRNI